MTSGAQPFPAAPGRRAGPDTGRADTSPLPVTPEPGAGATPTPPPPRPPGPADRAARVRHFAAQIETFEAQEHHLNEQIRTALAEGRKEPAREFLSRRLSVRARLEEARRRYGSLLEEQERLGSSWYR